MIGQGFDPAEPTVVTILYTNYRGETATRRVLPSRLWFGSVQWHQDPQWLLDAWDVEKGELRSFAVSQIHQWQQLAIVEDAAAV